MGKRIYRTYGREEQAAVDPSCSHYAAETKWARYEGTTLEDLTRLWGRCVKDKGMEEAFVCRVEEWQ